MVPEDVADEMGNDHVLPWDDVTDRVGFRDHLERLKINYIMTTLHGMGLNPYEEPNTIGVIITPKLKLRFKYNSNSVNKGSEFCICDIMRFDRKQNRFICADGFEILDISKFQQRVDSICKTLEAMERQENEIRRYKEHAGLKRVKYDMQRSPIFRIILKPSVPASGWYSVEMYPTFNIAIPDEVIVYFKWDVDIHGSVFTSNVMQEVFNFIDSRIESSGKDLDFNIEEIKVACKFQGWILSPSAADGLMFQRQSDLQHEMIISKCEKSHGFCRIELICPHEYRRNNSIVYVQNLRGLMARISHISHYVEGVETYDDNDDDVF